MTNLTRCLPYVVLAAAGLALLALAALPVGTSLALQASVACCVGLGLLYFLPGQTSRLVFTLLCAWVALRYLAWRWWSLPLDGSALATAGAVALLAAECYGTAMMTLGLFVNARPLEREPCALQGEPSSWPTVDVYIPTYSEPADLVGTTLAAACALNYPASRFKVYVLDDGAARADSPGTPSAQAKALRERTQALQALCATHGATWLRRDDNSHAKSGNLNAAMARTEGELVLVLDADHVPTRDFLQSTVGMMQADAGLAFVQTPHFFLNPDPVERNLGLFNRMPGESDMFYRVVQPGLDMWNASFFCGSAALLRRKALSEVGGFSTESITEDASSSIKLHQRGWRSAYLARPMVAGLQPETFASFLVQRLRWAMGMVQIFVKQNPLLVPGLSAPQRLSYLSVILFWFFPFARVIFFIAPLLSVVLNLTVYPVGLEFFQAYTVPYLLATLLSFERTFGKVRRIFVSEVYETLLAFYTLPALLSTLARPSQPSFKVTPKGERLNKAHLSEFRCPFYVAYALTGAGLLWGLFRMTQEPESRGALTLSVAWLGLNFVLLSAALGVIFEQVQRRASPRVALNEPLTLHGPFGQRQVVAIDANESCVRLRSLDGSVFEAARADLGGVRVALSSPCGSGTAGGATADAAGEWVAQFEPVDAAERQAVVGFVYGDSARWSRAWSQREASRNVLASALGVVVVAWRRSRAHIAQMLEQTR